MVGFRKRADLERKALQRGNAEDAASPVPEQTLVQKGGVSGRTEGSG